MAIRNKLSLAIFLLALFSNLALPTKENEVEHYHHLKTCKHLCQHQRTETDKRLCLQSCDIHKGEEEKKETRMHEGEEAREEEEEHKELEEEEENPYIFEQDDFDTEFETEAGRIDVLQKFTEKSKLLRGIQNYRLAILEANPHTFVAPRHFDSDLVLFIIKGQAILGLVRESETEKVMVEAGDMMTIAAGTPLYMVNRHANEKLFIAMLHIPVSTPGKFEEFFGPGGRDPESVLSAFSWNVLQAALQTPKRKLEKLFNQQNEGSIFEISREELSALAPNRSSWWPLGGPSKAPLNIFSKNPSFSNQYGRLTEVRPDDEKTGLQSHNLMLTLTNITQRCMSSIMYNSHATKIAVVIDGRGEVEIACPHVSSRSYSKHEKRSPSYQRISSMLKPGMAFVVPPAHPFVITSSNKENLLLICFEINAQHNKMFTFAGKNNVVSSLDNVAKELAFDYPANLVNGIFHREEEFFFPFELPNEEDGAGRADDA